MPREAKLGLIVGVALVILTAVIFFRRDRENTPAKPAASAAIATAQVNEYPRALVQPLAATPPAQVISDLDHHQPQLYRHTVRPGETLYSLARNYYNDSARFVDIYQANRHDLPDPEQLTPGTVLLIPSR